MKILCLFADMIFTSLAMFVHTYLYLLNFLMLVVDNTLCYCVNLQNETSTAPCGAFGHPMQVYAFRKCLSEWGNV